MHDTQDEKLLVYVIDDNDDVRDSIEWMLTSVGFIVQAYRDAQDCLRLIESDSFCCIVVDLLMPRMTGLEFCRQLFAINSSVSVVMISAHGDVETAVEAMKMGVSDFLVKPPGREQLLNAVNGGFERAISMQREVVEEDAVAQRMLTLTSRERSVFESVCEGMVTKQIAKKLEISPRTVDVHRASISLKMEIESPMQLAYVMMIEMRRKQRPARLTGRAHGR